MPLYLERLRRFFRRVKHDSSPIKGVLFVTLLSLLVGIAPAKMEATDTTQNQSQIVLALDQKSPLPLVSSSSKHEFVLGDSKAQTEEKDAAVKQAALDAQKKAQAAKLALASRDTITREKRVYTDPTDFASIYQNAGQRFGVDPKLLRAIHLVETGGSGSTDRRSSSGAVGPMQFLPSTFRNHAIDGNGDGMTDITNVEDAIFTAAKYLVDCGYPNMKQALWGYNPSYAYYNRVMSYID